MHILVFHQSLYFGEKLNHSLLCPNQTRDNGNKVEDTPRQYDRSSSHGITIAADGKLPSLFMPLKMQGVISYIDTRKPTEIEMETAQFYEVTADIPWDPHSDRFSKEEANFKVSLVGSSPNSKFCQESSVMESIIDPAKSEYI